MQDRLEVNSCAPKLKALAEPDRLKLIQCLQTGPKNVSELSALLEQEIANVSHHLQVLHHAGLVTRDKQGKFVVYALHPDVFQPSDKGGSPDALDFGCCRIELTGQ